VEEAMQSLCDAQKVDFWELFQRLQVAADGMVESVTILPHEAAVLVAALEVAGGV
jgi:hypothetical protein